MTKSDIPGTEGDEIVCPASDSVYTEQITYCDLDYRRLGCSAEFDPSDIRINPHIG